MHLRKLCKQREKQAMQQSNQHEKEGKKEDKQQGKQKELKEVRESVMILQQQDQREIKLQKTYVNNEIDDNRCCISFLHNLQ